MPDNETSPAGELAPYPPAEDLGEVLFDAETIAARVIALGREIADDCRGEVPLLVGILKGSAIFVADLMRAIPGPVELDFLAVSSYGAETKSSGVVKILKDLDRDINGRHVIVVEDIIDSGLTIAFLEEYLETRDPASVKTCTLLLRQHASAAGVADETVSGMTPDYVGFKIPPAFVIGYGLDVGERYRNLPYIATYGKA